MAGSFPGAATFWATYETAKSAAAPIVGAGMAPVIAAAAADVAVVAVRNPFEVVKQQMQSGMHQSTSAAVRRIIAVDGVAGLYAGYFSTVLREMPFDAIRETSQGLLTERGSRPRAGDDGSLHIAAHSASTRQRRSDAKSVACAQSEATKTCSGVARSSQNSVSTS